MGSEDGQAADYLRHGEPRARDHARCRQGGAPRCDHRHRAQRFSQPGQQCAGLPLHLPRRARRPGDRHQRGDEDRRRQRHCQAGARTRARRGRSGLWREPPLRHRLHHPRALRPAADGGGVERGRQGGDGFGRGAGADRRFRGVSP